MENNIQLNFATLALKGKRYSEAEAIYTQIAIQEKSPEAWVGIGICKLYQLANGRTMEEVIYCFEKAKQLNISLKADIEQQLIFNCQILLGAYLNVYSESLKHLKQQKKNARAGAILTGISLIAGMNTKSAFGFVASLAGTGAGVGVAIDAFSKMQNIEEIKGFIIQKCDEVNIAVKTNCDNESEEYRNYYTYVNNIISVIKQQIENENSNNMWDIYMPLAIFFGVLGIVFIFIEILAGLFFIIIAAILSFKAYETK